MAWLGLTRFPKVIVFIKIILSLQDLSRMALACAPRRVASPRRVAVRSLRLGTRSAARNVVPFETVRVRACPAGARPGPGLPDSGAGGRRGGKACSAWGGDEETRETEGEPECSASTGTSTEAECSGEEETSKKEGPGPPGPSGNGPPNRWEKIRFYLAGLVLSPARIVRLVLNLAILSFLFKLVPLSGVVDMETIVVRRGAFHKTLRWSAG